MKLWNSRDRISFVSGTPLMVHPSSMVWTSLFAHVIPKGNNKYPKFRLYPKNVVFLTPHEHHLYDHGTADQRRRYAEDLKVINRDCDWQRLYDLADELKEEYKNLEPGWKPD